MPKRFLTTEDEFRSACAEFWHTYYESMQDLHARQGRDVGAPIKDRNLGTTDARHVHVFERFWRRQLASALGVRLDEVGPRRIRFRPHRTKSFDVCWPLDGEPRILISIKSMQNAYRNFTNRIEEAFGDSAVLRLYRLPCAFGFFFFMLDGPVARGAAEQGRAGPGHVSSGRGKGVAPFLSLIEEGGDFFQRTSMAAHRKPNAGKSRGRQDVVELAQQSLLDLSAMEPSREGGIHYDAIAFAPTRVTRRKAKPTTKNDWSCELSPVDDRLDFRTFIGRLLDTARFRGLV